MVRQFLKQTHQFLPKLAIQNLFSVFWELSNVILTLLDCMICILQLLYKNTPCFALNCLDKEDYCFRELSNSMISWLSRGIMSMICVYRIPICVFSRRRLLGERGFGQIVCTSEKPLSSEIRVLFLGCVIEND